MEKGINLRAYEFREQLAQLVNSSDLPIVLIGQIFQEIQLSLKQLEIETVQKEKIDFEEKLKEGGEQHV